MCPFTPSQYHKSAVVSAAVLSDADARPVNGSAFTRKEATCAVRGEAPCGLPAANERCSGLGTGPTLDGSRVRAPRRRLKNALSASPAALPELPRHDPVPRRKRAVRGTALRSVEMDDRTSSVNGPRRGIVVLELISLEPGGCCCHSPTRARR